MEVQDSSQWIYTPISKDREWIELEGDVELKENLEGYHLILNGINNLIHYPEMAPWYSHLKAVEEHYTKLSKYYYDAGYFESFSELSLHVEKHLLQLYQRALPVSTIPLMMTGFPGSYYKIVDFYLRFLKNIIKTINPDLNKKWEICIDFDPGNLVNSDSFFIPFGSTPKEENIDSRLLFFEMPGFTIKDPYDTLCLLTHEIFHYFPYKNQSILVDKILEYGLKSILRFIKGQIKFDFGIEIKVGEDQVLGVLEQDEYEKLKSSLSKIVIPFSSASIEKENREVEITLGSFVQKLLKDVGNKKKKSPMLPFYQRHLVDTSIITFNILVSVIHEVIPDLNMAHLMNMTPCEYLLTAFKYKFPYTWTDFIEKPSQEESLQSIEDFSLNFTWRINLVLKNLLKKENRSEFILEEQKDYEKMDEKKQKLLQLIVDHLAKNQTDLLAYPIIFPVEAIDQNIYALELTFPLSKVPLEALKASKTSSIKEIFNLFKFLGVKSSSLPDSGSSLSTPLFGNYLGRINTLEEYMRYVLKVEKKLAHGVKEWLWMRGICDSTFNNVPSLFRDERLKSMTPYEALQDSLNEVYEKTIIDSDIWVDTYRDKKEHVSCLQHYGLSTNLLDFSTDYRIALYFALNPDNKEDQVKVKNSQYTPKVCFINPKKYMELIEKLNKELKLDSPISRLHSFYPTLMDYRYFPYVQYLEKASDLSDRFEEILDKKVDNKNEVAFLEEEIRKGLYLPMMLQIRLSNNRIRNQRGTFLAFDLLPRKNNYHEFPHCFKYLSLENIQTLIWNTFNKDEEHTFLYYITINPTQVRELNESLKLLGIEKSTVYPELHRIFKNIKGRQKKLS